MRIVHTSQLKQGFRKKFSTQNQVSQTRIVRGPVICFCSPFSRIGVERKSEYFSFSEFKIKIASSMWQYWQLSFFVLLLEVAKTSFATCGAIGYLCYY